MNTETINTPSAEVIELLKAEMTDVATLKLIKAFKEFEQYYGIEVTEMISQINFFTRYYQTSENKKREILETYNNYKSNPNREEGRNLFYTLESRCEADDRAADSISADMSDLDVLQKFISDLAVVFALNEPVYERKREENNQKFNS